MNYSEYESLYHEFKKEFPDNSKLVAQLRKSKLEPIIRQSTQWLPPSAKIVQRFFHYHTGLSVIPKCKYCNTRDCRWGRHAVGKAYHVSYYWCGHIECKKAKFTDIANRPDIKKKTTDNYKASMLEKYGVEHNWQTGELREKLKDANLKRWGEEWYNLTNEFKKKTKETNIDKYGVDHPYKSDVFLKTVKEKHGGKLPFHKGQSTNRASKHWVNYFEDGDYQLIEYKNKYEIKLSHIACGAEFTVSGSTIQDRKRHGVTLCTSCKPFNDNTSEKEKELCEWVKSIYSGIVLSNDRSILSGMELDIYLPDAKLAIEFNGTYWHSHKMKSPSYHQQKTLDCQSLGIQLIHVWECDWDHRPHVIKSIIASKLRLNDRMYARKCKINSIDYKTAGEFLDKYHIQGRLACSVYYGLYYDGVLIQVMTFNKRGDNSWELTRLCTKTGYTVVGGASKLLKRFITSNKWVSITTFAFADFSVGNVYKKMGFEGYGLTKPGYFYVDYGNNKYNRRSFQKKKLIKKGILGENDNESEWDVTDAMGLYRIHNAGNYKYALNNI